MQSPDTVIFDMDGVIIDSEPVHMNIEQQLYRELDLDISEEEHQAFVGTSTLEMWTSLVDKYNLDVSAGEISERKHERYMHWLESADRLPIIDGVRELIVHLHQSGKTLCLASSSSGQEIDCVLKNLRLETYFSFRISGADLPRSKPDPMIFLKAASLAQTPPDRCCVIEDSKNGVAAAKAAGMFCIGYQNPNSGNQDLSSADRVIDEFNSKKFSDLF
jgi:HAD superfamily hydrolase (TIGR01509 family)